MKSAHKIIYILLFCFCIPLVPVAHSNETTNELNGEFWKTLSTRSSEGSLLLYTSGYINGYDYALSQVLDAMKKQSYSSSDLMAFIDVLRFPDKITNRAVKELIDTFYEDKKNQSLPLFVAFTAARQSLQGYPKSYCASYLTKMREKYSPK